MMATQSMIHLRANGNTHQVEAGTRLGDFLQGCGFKAGQVVVEHNGSALTPGERDGVCLQEGDRLEIVRIVAGG